MKATVVVSASIMRDGKILLVKEGKEFCYGQWSFPGGRVEEEEGLDAAVVREVREETGYDVTITGMTRVLRYISQYGFHCVRFNFIAEIVGGTPRVDGTEILELRLFAPDDVRHCEDLQLRTPAIIQTIIDDLRAGAFHPVGIVYDMFAAAGNIEE